MVFCTKIDHRYLDRCLVLFSSLRKHCPDAELFVLSLSPQCTRFLQGHSLDGLHIVDLSSLLQISQLEGVRSSRSNASFVFTLTPFAILEVLARVSEGDMVTYVDADTMFFSPPDLGLFENDCNVYITPHNCSKHLVHLHQYGKYNTGWVSFRRNHHGLRCAEWWANRCLEWCDDRVEGSKFADQGYIQQFQSIVPEVAELDDIGINCAPWNASGRTFFRRDEGVFVDDARLVFFHFALARRINRYCFAPKLKEQDVRDVPGLMTHVYKPYARELARIAKLYGIPRDYLFPNEASRPELHGLYFAAEQAAGLRKCSRRILRGEYILTI